MMSQKTQLLQRSDDLTVINQKLLKSRRVVFLTGAGISCSAGIPDFRSSQGLYNMTEGLSGNMKGKDLFDISLFQSPESIQCFSVFMSNLYSSTLNAAPTKAHEFIYEQIKKNKVLRCYTQNIDGLEARLGLNTKFDNEEWSTALQKWKSMDVVQLHGDLNELSCTTCSKIVNWEEEFRSKLASGELPECPMCIDTMNKRVEQGKRLTGTIGALRPNIILYGENHPFSESIALGLNSDLKQRPDMLIIMGTSLKVHGVKQLVSTMSRAVHARGGLVVLINKDVLTGWNGKIDYQIQMDCDSFVQQYKSFEKGSRMLQTPPSTPKKVRIRDMINTPSPQKKRPFTVYSDPEPYPSPKELGRKLSKVDKSLNNRGSPKLKKIRDLLHEETLPTKGKPLSTLMTRL